MLCVWFNVSSGQIKDLCIFERNCLRKCINFEGPRFNNNKYILNRELYYQVSMQSLLETMMIFSIKQLEKTLHHPNNLINILLSIEETTHRTRYRPPQYIVHAHNSNLLFDQTGRLVFYENINKKHPP